VLDEVFINRPDIYSTTVLRSLLKTKHSAVLVRPVIDRQICNKVVAKRKKVSLYDIRQCNIDKLRWWLGRPTFDWTPVIACDSVTTMYSQFLQIVCDSITDHVILIL